MINIDRRWDKLEVHVRNSPYVIVSMGTEGYKDGMDVLSDSCARLELSLLLWRVSGPDDRSVCDLKPQIMQESSWHAGMPCVWVDADDDLLEAPGLTSDHFERADVILSDNPELKIMKTHLTFASTFGVAPSKGGRAFLKQWEVCTATEDLFGAAHRAHDHRALHMAYYMAYGRAKPRCVFLNATEAFRGCQIIRTSAESSRRMDIVS